MGFWHPGSVESEVCSRLWLDRLVESSAITQPHGLGPTVGVRTNPTLSPACGVEQAALTRRVDPRCLLSEWRDGLTHRPSLIDLACLKRS